MSGPAGGDAMDEILEQWSRERPDLDCSPMGVIGRISQLQREVFLAQRATFARHGLDAPAFDVLAALRRAGEPYQLTPTALMRTALVTSGAITQRLDRLEEKGLITRGRSDVDGRAVVVTLTEAGRTALSPRTSAGTAARRRAGHLMVARSPRRRSRASRDRRGGSAGRPRALPGRSGGGYRPG